VQSFDKERLGAACASMLNVCAAAMRTRVGSISYVRVRLDVRPQLQVQRLKEPYVLLAVTRHLLPGFLVSLHYTSPQVESLVFHLRADPKVRRYVRKPVASQAEPLDRFQQINAGYRRRSRIWSP
jgi:hypothetical protein